MEEESTAELFLALKPFPQKPLPGAAEEYPPTYAALYKALLFHLLCAVFCPVVPRLIRSLLYPCYEYVST
jgi:hypothetical protein